VTAADSPLDRDRREARHAGPAACDSSGWTRSQPVPVSGSSPPGRDRREPGRMTASQRINSDPESVERGLVTLVLTLVELLRQLMERQALRRVEDGSLTDEQVENVGQTLMSLESRMAELTEHFELSPGDLNIDLGPLGPLLPRE
jgi:gas vesicle protein GvpK